MTIESIDSGGTARELTRSEPLDSVEMSPNGAIEISVGGGVAVHRIKHTRAIRIREEAPHAVKVLTIESENERVLLRFRSAMPPELVDGIATY